MKVGDRVRIKAGARFGKFGEIIQQHSMGPGFWLVYIPEPPGYPIVIVPYTSLELELAPLAKVVPYQDITVTCSLKLHAFQVCARCNTRNDFADPNQPDGSYICYECR